MVLCVIRGWLLTLFIHTALLQAQSLHTSNSLIEAGIVSTNLYDRFVCQDSLLSSFDAQYSHVPLTFYSKAMRYVQRNINQKVSDFVITNQIDQSPPSWLSYDSLSITPSDWIWIDLLYRPNKRDTSFISLRRPSRWLPYKSKPGDSILINMPEMGVMGWATICKIRESQLDSRFSISSLQCVKPIIGKFLHQSSQVYQLTFEGYDKPLAATGNHLFWSLDRLRWEKTSSLKPGDVLKSYHGAVVVKSNILLPARHTVYNLEVYRDHVYHAGEASVLTHNVCLAAYLVSKAEKLVLGKGHILQLPDNRTLLTNNPKNKGVFRANFGLNITPDVGTVEHRILAAMEVTVARNGEILMILDDVNIEAARSGLDFWTDAVGWGRITEWELATILRNRKYYDIAKVSKDGQVVSIGEVEGLEYIGP